MFAKQLMTRKDKKMAKKGKTIFVCQEWPYQRNEGALWEKERNHRA